MLPWLATPLLFKEVTASIIKVQVQISTRCDHEESLLFSLCLINVLPASQQIEK